MKRNVGIFIFDDVEVLDFAGPFEVFSVSSELNNHRLFNVFTVGKNTTPVIAVNGLSVNPKYDFETTPNIDILIIAGGAGVRAVMKDQVILDWVNQTHQKTELTLSICSGATILGVLGILDNQPFCTHHEVYERMKVIAPMAVAQKNERFTSFDKVYTSGGISAGIDLSFYIVEMLHGKKIANETACYMEYNNYPV